MFCSSGGLQPCPRALTGGSEVRAAPEVRTGEAGTGDGGLSCCVAYPTEPLSLTVAKTHPVPLKDPTYFSKEREVGRLFISPWESLAL